jgi:hypothetical protein
MSLALLVGVWVLALALPAAGQAPAVDIGDKAPDFTLPSTTGDKISLGQFLGKKLVLLEFYGADFSPV